MQYRSLHSHGAIRSQAESRAQGRGHGLRKNERLCVCCGAERAFDGVCGAYHIKVNDGNAFEAIERLCVGNPNHDVVVNAESASFARLGMMPGRPYHHKGSSHAVPWLCTMALAAAARRRLVVDTPTKNLIHCCAYQSRGSGGGCLRISCHHRVLVKIDPRPNATRGRPFQALEESIKRVEVLLSMHTQQLFLRHIDFGFTNLQEFTIFTCPLCSHRVDQVGEAGWLLRKHLAHAHAGIVQYACL
jgi:hypothetical protein